MSDNSSKLLLIGSKVRIVNLPIKEVSLLAEGSLPAYGYNPGDFIELLAGPVKVEKGRLEQCRAWLSGYIASLEKSPVINAVSYGEPKEIYQIFRQRAADKDTGHGWFMFQQILPSEGRIPECNQLELAKHEAVLSGNTGIVVIDDSGRPPCLAAELLTRNDKPWVIAMGISAAHWQDWALRFKTDFHLLCRLADLETTRMEMDSSVNWESIVAMAIKALKSPEVGLWDSAASRFCCHIIVEMYPHGILYLGPNGYYFRHRPGSLPEKSSPRYKGSTPCYDTLLTSMLVRDCLESNSPPFCRNYFYDFSCRVLANWHLLYEQGYSFANGLHLPRLDFSASFQNGRPCSNADLLTDPYFIELDHKGLDFDGNLEKVACQAWDADKKKALRVLFPFKSAYAVELAGQAQAPSQALTVICEVLHHLKEEVSWKRGFERLRLYHVGNLRTTDPVEIEPVVTLQHVMSSYAMRQRVQRPLCVGVFGPPGSGKSFSVKEVARVIAGKFASDPFEFFEFNLTQFGGPDEINSAIEPVRATVAKGKIPIVFWDEFDCRYDNHEFGYLRYFLPAMQDGVTYVNGTPYNIGRAIFVFAGGVKASWEDMERLLTDDDPKALQFTKTLKIPDFMSRLRVVLDIEGINMGEHLFSDSASPLELEELRRILMKRAFIIAHQMDTHWKQAARKTSGLLLRLLLARYKFGARSIEAVIESSGAVDRLVYGLPELIAPAAARIHATWRVELERKVDAIRKGLGVRAVW
ncbi:MAG TPA: AAA family ATPase [Desulfobacterales bacterium]|nr:AAA family ATPase [Desulfobacterales bacterium]